MRLLCPPSRISPPASRAGVALIVTIIMLSVITFLTVAFLALTGREKGSTKQSTNQTTARLGAETALDRVKVELLTSILASRNINNFDLLVSTNTINYNGFDPSAFDQLTNVNYDYQLNGSPLSLNQQRQNLTNLLYDPRPPVFITNRLAANSQEFRYYLDLNRNGRHDRSGFVPVTNDLGQVVFQPGTNLNVFQTTYVNGDPEWIGVGERAGQPHGPDNKFVARYAFIAIPAGKTMDVNYVHNQALAGGSMSLNGQDYFRNQGVGGWEINMGAFLYDLNTNAVGGWGGPGGYNYDITLPKPASGISFDDAAAIYRYRVNGNPNLFNYSVASLPSVAGLYGAAGTSAFQNDFMDGYSSYVAAPFSTNGLGFVSAGYLAEVDNTGQPWVGANHQYALFTTQDLFNRAKTSTSTPGYKFADRLDIASTNISTYDQYTYYRLLSQLGTDSAPEDPGKLNLNYVNVGGFAATNFVPWTDPSLGPNAAVLFFTNAVDRLLKAYSTEWLASDYSVYTNLFQNDQIFGVTNIPVLVSNRFVYSPAVHRLLQVAANLWDAKPNSRAVRGLPTVFRPRFAVRGENIYISDFVEEQTTTSIAANTPGREIVDILATNNPTALIPPDGNVLIFGVPPVVGALKGLPNFNEFQLETIFTMTRKIQLRRQGGAITETNQFYTMSLTMPSAAEFWNSYASNYSYTANPGIIITITNRTTLTMTNDLGINFTRTFITGDRFETNTAWPRHKTTDTKSLITLMRQTVPFVPTIGYLPGSGFVSATNQNLYDTSQNLLMPRWGITISNRVHAMVLRPGTEEIIDYVLLGNMVYRTNLTDMIINPGTGTGDAFTQLWATNNYGPNPALVSGRLGVQQQINISLGSAGTPPPDSEWRQYGTFAPSTPLNEINFFRDLYFNSSSNGYFNVPFTPTVQFRVPMIWEANDPLVHYNANDLFYIDKSEKMLPIKPPLIDPPGVLDGVGKVNDRYKPWDLETVPASPNGRELSVKDSLVTSSDEWQFPTNLFPTVGWIGRVHRGTPWQTVYLKAYDVGGVTNRVNSPTEWVQSPVFNPAAQRWARWSGNRILEEGFYSRPVSDRILFDVFTTAVNENATRGRLPINQTGLAAWSAVFSGMVALTNNSSGLTPATSKPLYRPMVIEPAGVYNLFDTNNWPALVRLVNGINRTRTNLTLFPSGSFNNLGDILATPELTIASPFLNLANKNIPIRGIPDTAYEWLPQQMMSLLQLGEPRFVIYAYGQSLQPAPDSILVGGAYNGLCTNYTITAEVATRTVVRIEGSPNPNDTNPTLPPKKRYPPHLVVESFNFLPPD